MDLSGAEYLIAVLAAFYLGRSYTVFTLSSRSVLGVALDGMPIFPSKLWDAEDRIVLGCTSRPFGLSLPVLSNISPWLGPWVLR